MLFPRQVLSTSLLTIIFNMLFRLFTKFKGIQKECLAWGRRQENDTGSGLSVI